MMDGGEFNEELVERLRLTTHHPVTGRLAMIEAYETKYGILNHDSEEVMRDSLSLVRMNDAEEPVRYSPFERRVWEYSEREINKHFGLNLFEFLEQPRHIVEMLLSVAESLQRAEYMDNRKKLQELEDNLK